MRTGTGFIAPIGMCSGSRALSATGPGAMPSGRPESVMASFLSYAAALIAVNAESVHEEPAFEHALVLYSCGEQLLTWSAVLLSAQSVPEVHAAPSASAQP